MPITNIEGTFIDYVQILDENGNFDESIAPDLTDDDVRTIYWHMNVARILNSKMLNLQKQGRMGTFASTFGQEGCQVALAHALNSEENAWFVPSFRENPFLVAKGVPLNKIMEYWGGRESGSKDMAKLKILPPNIPVGSTSIHAVGISMAINIKKEKGIAVAFHGDGATSEGEFHEAMNFAGVFKTPTIFFCQNNGYAISIPTSKQTASKTLAQKAHAYGIKGVRVDGNDIFAVCKIVKEAYERAKEGEGATFIEAMTYRLGNHTTADDWKKYRSKEEVAEWIKKDPITRLRIHLMKKGIWSDEQEKTMLQDAENKILEAVKTYEAMEKPKVEDMFDHMYGELPPDLVKQKEEYTRFWSEN